MMFLSGVRLPHFIITRTVKKILVASTCIILISVGGYYGYQRCRTSYVENGVRYTRDLCGSIKSAVVLETPPPKNDKKVDAKVYRDTDAGYWELVDTDAHPPFPTGLKLSGSESSGPTIVRWNNYLISPNIEQYVGKSGAAYLGSAYAEHFTLQLQIRTVRVYNIDTGETFDISLDKPTWGEIWDTTGQVVDNAYYFGVGGAYGASLGYRLDLPPQRGSRVVKLDTGMGNRITKYGSLYVGSFCYEGCSYTLDNLKAGTSIKLERMTEAANGRDTARLEQYIGVDNRGRMILNIRAAGSGQLSPKTSSIAAVPLTDEQTTIPFIKGADLPEQMIGYYMAEGGDRILMLGAAKAYTYDIPTGGIQNVQTGQAYTQLVTPGKTVNATSLNTMLCLSDGGGAAMFAVDMTDGSYKEPPPADCPKPYATKNTEDIMQELQLPDNLRFVYMPVVYRTYDVLKGVPQSELPEGAEVIE